MGLWWTWLLLSSISISILAVEETELSGDNVCVEQREEIKVVNVSFTTRKSVKEYTWCVNVPPRCPVYRDKLVRGSRPEEVRRVRNLRVCCNGHEQVDGVCRPKCVEQCLHGKCVAPDTCECHAGFSGSRCETLGCEQADRWGVNCTNSCHCVRDQGVCDPRSGTCLCLPGFEGVACEKACVKGRYGRECSKKCECSIGQICHHVTGDCVNCANGHFGVDCGQKCQCHEEGTSLCYHLDGRCFCKMHFYGTKCEKKCQFGFRDNICLNQPDQLETCKCASDLYTCHPQLGCVCKNDGEDCHLYSSPIIANMETDESGNDDNWDFVNVGLGVLVLAMLLFGLLAFYYRRRMRRLQKDLGNRSVRFFENAVNVGLGPDPNHVVVVNNDERGQRANNTLAGDPGAVGNVLNNARVKNVNIERFKLATSDTDNHAVARENEMEENSHDNHDHDDERALRHDFDINLYEEYKANNDFLERLKAGKSKMDNTTKANYDNERNTLFEQVDNCQNNEVDDHDNEVDELKRHVRLQFKETEGDEK